MYLMDEKAKKPPTGKTKYRFVNVLKCSPLIAFFPYHYNLNLQVIIARASLLLTYCPQLPYLVNLAAVSSV